MVIKWQFALDELKLLTIMKPTMREDNSKAETKSDCKLIYIYN